MTRTVRPVVFAFLTALVLLAAAPVSAQGLKVGVFNKQRIVDQSKLGLAQKARFEEVAPILEGNKADIVGLCMDDSGIPRASAKVVENAVALVEKLEALGLSRSSIFLDPLIQPVSTDTDMGKVALTSMATMASSPARATYAQPLR